MIGVRRWGVSAVLAILLAAAPAGAQTFDWRAASRDSAALVRAGRFDAAKALIAGALQSCPAAGSAVEAGLCTAIFQENLSYIDEKRGDLPGAEEALQACVAAREAVLPADHRLVGDCLLELAAFYGRTDRLADQVATLLRAEPIIRAGGAARTVELIGVLNLRVTALIALQRFAEAVPPAREAVDLAEAKLGWSNPGTAVLAANLSVALIGNGGFGDAYSLDLGALSRPEAAGYSAESRARLAGGLAEASRTPEQIGAAHRLVAAAMKELDAGAVTNPDAAVTLLYGASRMLYLASEFEAAATLGGRAVTVASHAFGPGSFAAAKSLWSEGQAEAELGDNERAVAHLSAAFTSTAAPGFLRSHVGIALDLAAVFRRDGRDADANETLAGLLASPNLAASPGRAPELLRLGAALVEGGDPEHGAAACTDALAAARDAGEQDAAKRCLAATHAPSHGPSTAP